MKKRKKKTMKKKKKKLSQKRYMVSGFLCPFLGSGLGQVSKGGDLLVHLSVGYRVPEEWATMTEAQRGVRSLAGFKRGSRAGLLAVYAGFACAGCYVCAGQ